MQGIREQIALNPPTWTSIENAIHQGMIEEIYWFTIIFYIVFFWGRWPGEKPYDRNTFPGASDDD